MPQMGSVMQHSWQLHSNPCLFREAKLKAVFKELGVPGQVFWEDSIFPRKSQLCINPGNIQCKAANTEAVTNVTLHNKLQRQCWRIDTRSATGLRQVACPPLHPAVTKVFGAEHGFGSLQTPAVPWPGGDAEPWWGLGAQLPAVVALDFLPRGKPRPGTIKQHPQCPLLQGFQEIKEGTRLQRASKIQETGQRLSSWTSATDIQNEQHVTNEGTRNKSQETQSSETRTGDEQKGDLLR